MATKLDLVKKVYVNVIAAKDAKPGMRFAGVGELLSVQPAKPFCGTDAVMLALTFERTMFDVSDNAWLTLEAK